MNTLRIGFANIRFSAIPAEAVTPADPSEDGFYSAGTGRQVSRIKSAGEGCYES
jgi:hypothetical protein